MLFSQKMFFMCVIVINRTKKEFQFIIKRKKEKFVGSRLFRAPLVEFLSNSL
jgi:hypothetical protein